METKALPGEYHIQGVREMASGFLLEPDGNFRFFFAYGALDRYGSGKWIEKNGELFLNSAAKPTYDFALVSSKTESNDFINIKMEGANPVLLGHVFCSLQNGAEGSWKQMSQRGDVQFPKQKVESVSLLLEFCPERFSTIPVSHTEHNEFTFHFEPTIIKVFFENFSLLIEPDGLTGRHPLLEGEKFTYSRQ